MTTYKANALILAGGFGTRLKPITNNLPKCLVPVNDEPLLNYWINSLKKAGINKAVVNTHFLAEQVRVFIKEVKINAKFDLVESFEPELLGSAGTIRDNVDLANDADYIIVIYADNLSDLSMSDFLDFHINHSKPGTMMLFHAENPSACGIATLDENQNIIDFIEKPKMPTSDLANAGLYIFDADIYREIASSDGFDIGHDILPSLVGRMRGYIHNGYHRDIGTIESLEQANVDINSGQYPMLNKKI